MSEDRHNPQTQSLTHLYKESKQQHPAPFKIKQAAIEKIRSQQETISILTLYKDWLPLTSAAAVALIVIGLFSFNHSLELLGPQEHVASRIVVLESHGFSQGEQKTAHLTEALPSNHNYAQKKEHYLKQYQDALRSMEIASTRIASIEVIDQHWMLKDCENNLIEISDKLIAQLKTEYRIESGLDVGEQVELAMSETGLILSIKTSAVNMCS